jgi:hypothetical protein
LLPQAAVETLVFLSLPPSAAGSIRSTRGPSQAGGVSGALPHAFPRRTLRANQSLSKRSRRSSVSSLVSVVEPEPEAGPGGESGAVPRVVLSLRTGGGGSTHRAAEPPSRTPTRRGRRRNLAGNEMLCWDTLLPRCGQGGGGGHAHGAAAACATKATGTRGRAPLVPSGLPTPPRPLPAPCCAAQAA